MKELIVINDTAENRVSYYHLLSFVAALPFDRVYSQVIMISFAIHTLIHLKKKNLRRITDRKVWIPASVFILNLAAVFYSQDKNVAFNELFRQLPILVFPLLFAMISLDVYKYRKQLLVFFSIVCSLTILYLFLVSFRTIINYGFPARALLSPAFINHNFSYPIGIHATYFSIYTALCLTSCLYFIMRPNTRIWRFIYGANLLILSAGLVELSSRAVLIGVCIIITIFPFFVLERKKRVKFSLAAFALLVLALFGTLKIDALRNRFIKDLGMDLSEPLTGNVLSESRITRWKSAIPLIKKSPFVGYGTGSEKELLKEKYFENKLYRAYIFSLDAHNQYLSFLIKTGIVGLVVFLFVLGYGFKAAMAQRDIIFIAFMVLVTIVSVSENILDVNKGIFFYSFFFSLFLALPRGDVKQ